MKLLAFTDYHESDTCFAQIKKKAAEADVLLCCGDFTIFGNNAEKELLRLNKLGKPVILIPGNHEDGNPIDELCEELENVYNADRSVVQLDHFSVFGYNNGGFTREDKELENLLPQVKKNMIQPLIMITHGPPSNTKLDKLPFFGHVGNKSINKAIKELKPKILFCGHLHETFGVKDKIENTLIINPGPVGMIVEIKNEEKK